VTASIDIITLAEAKTHLNMGTGTTDDAELGNFITAASTMWVRRVGAVNTAVKTFDEWYDGGHVRVALANAPVVTITKVEEVVTASAIYTLTLETLQSGGDTGAYGYTVDMDRGLLVRRAAGVAVPFTPGVRNIHVVYTAGYATAPEDIKLAVKLLVAHMWETQRGGAKRPGTGADPTPLTGFMWPHRVEEIANGYIVPGIA
jgi:uncharacterized phiE125 gp8 family phage protein